jgi:hypothetical protein
MAFQNVSPMAQKAQTDVFTGLSIGLIANSLLGWASQASQVQAGLGKAWSSLTQRSPRLLDLSMVEASCTVINYFYTGRQSVPLNQIRGSASPGRCHDFDANFRPLNNLSKSRLESVAKIRQQGRNLPPVHLIKVGQIYFVEDGHHRISVAKKWGEESIEAEITVWQVAEPLPW